ncbi:MAG: 1,4-alpha-glucan branching protein domain-containing protein, partial [Nitriliruptorales bacterium]|nr:1,4-alpha-glucan branching protein domain-containing protein [Nitriliruptorales bacterium]
RGSYGLHPSWRVTDLALEPYEKSPYVPDAASKQVDADAEHFHATLRATLDQRPGQVVVAAYDTELYGHWWFEGVEWLEATLRRIHDDPHLRTTTLRSRRERCPPQRRLELPESSWGYAKSHVSWAAPATREMWRLLREAEQRVRTCPGLTSADPSVAAQVARELALAATSDWPFMVTRGKAPRYATDRLKGHVGRVHALCDVVEQDPSAGPEVAAEFRQLDDAPQDPTPLVAALLGDHNLPARSLVEPGDGGTGTP